MTDRKKNLSMFPVLKLFFCFHFFRRFCAIVNLNIECTFHGSCVAFETAYCSNGVTVDFALCILTLHVCRCGEEVCRDLRWLILQNAEDVDAELRRSKIHQLVSPDRPSR